MGYGFDDQAIMFRFPTMAKCFPFLHSVQTASYPVGSGGCFLEVKRPGRDAVYSRPSSVEDKNGAAIYQCRSR
jgi:hypothetical protein